MGAINCKQWYVTISRGRKNVEVFTDDSRRLRQDIQRTGDREFAIQPAAVVKATTKPKQTREPELTPLDEALVMSMRYSVYKAAQARRASQSLGPCHGMSF